MSRTDVTPDTRVAIVGASGYLGGELVRLLADHPVLRPALLAARSNAGEQLGAIRPNLAGLGSWELEPASAEAIAERCGLAFLALPHGASAALAIELLERGVPVIDLGSDFRLNHAADYPRYYRREHPAPSYLERAVYCLPELTGAPPEDAPIIACPGCFATALAMTLAPLVPALGAEARVAVSGMTGSSGSGASPSAGVHHSLRHSNLVGYKPLAHQHLGEVRQLLIELHGRFPAIDFVPHSAPLVRGILLTAHLREDELEEDPLELYHDAYGDQPLVDVVEGPVPLGAVVGSLRVRIGVASADGAVVVWTAIDNLLKGGAGQAVQIANLRAGLPLETGLPRLGIWP